jgi:hypothetical protein
MMRRVELVEAGVPEPALVEVQYVHRITHGVLDRVDVVADAVGCRIRQRQQPKPPPSKQQQPLQGLYG